MCSRTICPGMQAGSPRRIEMGPPLQQTYLHFQISTDQKSDSLQAIYICLSPETFAYIQMNNEQCVDLPACKITVSLSWASSCILHLESVCRATSGPPCVTVWRLELRELELGGYCGCCLCCSHFYFWQRPLLFFASVYIKSCSRVTC